MKKEGEVRIPSGCALTGIFSRSGKRISGADAITSIATMHDRSNGLGGGFAGYGIYPEYKQYYALHIFYNTPEAKRECEAYLERKFDVINLSEIPVRNNPAITNIPLIWRYFTRPLQLRMEEANLDEKEYVVRCVNHVNSEITDAFVFSSGKNMGVFKAVGFPEDVGNFFRLEDYQGYCWTGHGRYPTNTPGWWGGAHPFTLLDFSVVHNGEISSYDTNRRYIEMFGYKCSLLTDTEVITYLLDYLIRKQQFSPEEAAHVIAAPFWQTIEAMDDKNREQYKFLRQVFPELLINGPFSILFGFTGGIMALNDRLKLRSMVAAEKGDFLYLASEECAIRAIESDPDCVWAPTGGEPVIATLNQEGRKCL
ncbi:MAG: glutamine amidotransferase family protein [Spirochaetaceae bacterium]|jgi:glutamate synthase domain-containing protein 1|nr:glutamine amidotransferase family protein [Spirochaetaceae bacterium]